MQPLTKPKHLMFLVLGLRPPGKSSTTVSETR